MRYIWILLLTLGSCFGLQFFALRAVGGRTIKSESNFFSSLGRIQAGARGGAEVLFLGSSITGRLPDRAQGVPGAANMGCDGGSAVETLRAMDEGILPIAPSLVIECNTLQLAMGGKASEVGQAMRRPWFGVGLKLPAFAAYARPSAFFYSKLLARKIGGFGSGSGQDDLGVSSRPELVVGPPADGLSKSEEYLIGEVTGILQRLQIKGSLATLVWLPPARNPASTPPPWILELARQAEVPYWDLGQEAVAGTVTLTDGVHMAAPSAARTVRSLMKGIDR